MRHPPRGTCVPGCEFFGYCHDGCGQQTSIAASSAITEHRVKGRPRVFVHQHHHGHVPQRRSLPAANIPVERVRPLLRWLLDRYGYERTALICGLASGHIPRIMGSTSGPRGHALAHVRPDTAQRITDAVLFHKRGPRGWASPYEVEPTTIPPAWRKSIDDARAESHRRNKQRERAGLIQVRHCADCGKRVLTDSDRCARCREKTTQDSELAAINQRRFGSGHPPLVRTG